MDRNKIYLNSDEVATILRVSKRTLQNYRAEGKIMYHKISKKQILYKVEEVEEFLRQSSCVSYQKDRIKILLDRYIVKPKSQIVDLQ